MDENKDMEGPSPSDILETAIERLKGALEVLDRAGVPLACAYVDLALSLCREDQARRK